MKQRRTKGRENSRELCVPPPLLGERAGVRASVFSNLIFGVVGSNSSGKTRSFRADYSGDEIADLDEDRRSTSRSPSLPNRTGGSPASGFPVGSSRWAGSGFGSEMFGRNLPAAQSLRTRSPSHGRPTAGSGTQMDPYDGSTATKFDTLMSGASVPANSCVHLGPGIFDTAGYYDGLSGSGFQAKTGWRIVGSGIDVTTLRLVTPATTQRVYAIAHALSSSTVDSFEVSDLTIDCNFVPAQGTSWTAGAVRVMGNHSRVVRVKVINWGNKSTGTPGFVIAMLTGDPSNGVTGVLNCGIEECIAVNPHASAAGPVI